MNDTTEALSQNPSRALLLQLQQCVRVNVHLSPEDSRALICSELMLRGLVTFRKPVGSKVSRVSVTARGRIKLAAEKML